VAQIKWGSGSTGLGSRPFVAGQVAASRNWSRKIDQYVQTSNNAQPFDWTAALNLHKLEIIKVISLQPDFARHRQAVDEYGPAQAGFGNEISVSYVYDPRQKCYFRQFTILLGSIRA
jgi:hypothetical protein